MRAKLAQPSTHLATGSRLVSLSLKPELEGASFLAAATACGAVVAQ